MPDPHQLPFKLTKSRTHFWIYLALEEAQKGQTPLFQKKFKEEGSEGMVSRRGSGVGEDDAPSQGDGEDQVRVLTPERRDEESWTWIETPKGGCLHWQEDGELQEEEVEEFEEGLDCDARLERVLASIKVRTPFTYFRVARTSESKTQRHSR
jgi:hypothetical protein